MCLSQVSGPSHQPLVDIDAHHTLPILSETFQRDAMMGQRHVSVMTST